MIKYTYLSTLSSKKGIDDTVKKTNIQRTTKIKDFLRRQGKMRGGRSEG